MKDKQKWLYVALLSCSVSMLTMILSLSTRGDGVIKVLSVIISFVGTFILLIMFDYKKAYESSCIVVRILAFLVAFFSVDLIRIKFVFDWDYYVSKIKIIPETYSMILFFVALIICVLALYVYYTLLFDFLYSRVIKGIVLSMDDEEKKIFFSFTCIMFFVLIYVYSNTSAFSLLKYYDAEGNVVTLRYDAILDCDSAVTESDITNFVYRFRHPMYFFVGLPEYAFSRALSFLFYNNNQACLAIFACFRIIKLAIVGLCVKRMVGSKWAMIILYTSFPFILYSLVTERHVDILFWLIIMVWFHLYQEEENYVPIMYSGGVTLIGVVITPAVMKVKTVKEFITKAIKLALMFLFLIVATGQLSGLLNIANDVEHNNGFVSNESIGNNLSRFTVAIKNSFGDVGIWCPTSYSTIYSESGTSIFGIAVLICCVVAIIVLRKERYARICGYWFAICVVLFPIVGFSSYDYSMHMIIFSWAYISLLVMLGKHLFGKNKYKYIFNALITIFIVVQVAFNCDTFIDLLSYAARFNYIE